jgi:hypothetical protein
MLIKKPLFGFSFPVDNAYPTCRSTYHKYVESGYYGKVDLEKMQESVNNMFFYE